MARLDREKKEFPEQSRIMPTKLGNVLRSNEDELQVDGDLSGFVMRNRHLVPTRVLMHHDQFRTRLDMYCLLVFVSASVAVISIPLLWELKAVEEAGVTLTFLVMARVSYGAAVASARGYGTALREIDRSVRAARLSTMDEDRPTSEAESPA